MFLLHKSLFNEKRSVKTQVLSSFLIIVLVSAGVTLAICLGILYGTASNAVHTARTKILAATEQTVFTNAQEVADTISQELSIIAHSVCMVGAQYSSILLPYTSPGGSSTILKPYTSYREYNFVDGCTYPLCPSDYGPFNGKTRIPPVSSLTSGSISHTSTYLYSTTLKGGARNDTAWNLVQSQFPNTNQVVNALSYQDIDMQTLYFRGPNTTVFFYVSSQIGTSSSYASVHRTFPGISKSNDPSYNPPGRPWFVHAPVNSYYLYGPYKETFTQQLVINLSSRQSTSLPVNGRATTTPVALVTSAVFLLSDLTQIVNSVPYTNGGFGALISASTNQVLVWGKNTNTYVNEAFLTLAQIDPNLARKSFSRNGTFTYTDMSGVNWVVASVVFFPTSDYLNPAAGSTNALVALVFAKQSEAQSPLPSLEANVQSTTKSVTTTTVVIIAALVGGVVLLILGLVIYITAPLDKMRAISAELVRIAAEDEEKKDYTDVMGDAFLNQKRRDEVGALTEDYFGTVCLLNNKTVAKREKPKYPVNPFYVESGPVIVTWDAFTGGLGLASSVPAASQSSVPVVEDKLDVLGSLNRTGMFGAQLTQFTAVPTSDTGPQSVVLDMPFSSSHTVDIPRERAAVGTCASISTKFYAISALLLSVLVIVMIITVVSLADEGSAWMAHAGADIDAKQMESISTIAYAKAEFVKAFFVEMNVNVLCAAAYASQVLNGGFTNSTFAKSHNLQSFSLDSNNPYSQGTVSPSTAYSGYFYPASQGCSSTQCSQFENLAETQVTSVFDLKLRSFFYVGSMISLIQIGMQDTGMVRNLPYSASSTGFSNTQSCLIGTTNTQVCASLYSTSACSGASSSYPAYDPRCRPWYQFAISPTAGNPNLVYFQYPRKSSSGSFLSTAVAPLRAQNSPSGSVQGVLNFNVLAAALSNSVNSLKVLSTGYCYLVDSANTTQIILSPYASSTCSNVACAEGFSKSEYTAFFQTVLAPLASNGKAASSYTKKGQTWRLATASVNYATISYTLIVTVPESEVQAASIAIQQAINKNVGVMIGVFVACIVIFTAGLVYFSIFLVRCIVEPINRLRLVLDKVINDDLSGKVDFSEASSLDMHILLKAFSDLMVALRFGSDSYARGKRDLALQVFSEALVLYEQTENVRGVASAHNNLGAVNMDKQKYKEAEDHLMQAISGGSLMLADLMSAQEKNQSSWTEAQILSNVKDCNRLRRILSDRKGNLVVLYLESNNLEGASSLIKQLLLEDQKNGYIMGCVVKQGIFGHYYLRLNKYEEANQYMKSALDFVTRKDAEFFGADWNLEEAEVAEQVATYNYACLDQAQGKDAEAEALFIRSLSKSRNMHVATVTKLLASLRSLYASQGLDGRVQILNSLAEKHDFNIDAAAAGGRGGAGGPKRVAFLVDYSGSMSGAKIKAAVENVLTVFETHISGEDSAMLIHFTNKVYVDFDLLPKSGHEEMMRAKISALTNPNNTTAFYDSIARAMDAFNARPTKNDWIVALTDGEDNGSSLSEHSIKARLHSPSNDVNLIVIGVGEDVKTGLLEGLAKATKQGMYVFAKGDKKSIDDAFGKAIAVIQGQIILED